MAKTILQLDQVEPYAIASRTLSKAEAFKDEYGFKVAYGGYEEMIADENHDIVYVATPHSRHYEDVKMCLDAGHHVLCEKPLTVNSKQASELYKLASEKDLLLVDATWIRFMPFISLVKQAAIKHRLGKLKHITASLGISKLDSQRMVDPELAGGALLDLGIYPLNFALIFAHSSVSELITTYTEYHTGVDESNRTILLFENGVSAVCQSSMHGILSPNTSLSYEKGRIELFGMPNVSSYTVYDVNQEKVETYEVPTQISGYEYQVLEMIDQIENNQTEMKSFTIDQSLEVLELMDKIRERWGLVYPFE